MVDALSRNGPGYYIYEIPESVLPSAVDVEKLRDLASSKSGHYAFNSRCSNPGAAGDGSRRLCFVRNIDIVSLPPFVIPLFEAIEQP